MRMVARSVLVAAAFLPLGAAVPATAFAGTIDAPAPEVTSHPGEGCSTGSSHQVASGGSIVSSVTSTVSELGIDQDLEQSQENDTEQHNTNISPVVQVNPAVDLGGIVPSTTAHDGYQDNRIVVDNDQANRNSTRQGQQACQAAGGA